MWFTANCPAKLPLCHKTPCIAPTTSFAVWTPHLCALCRYSAPIDLIANEPVAFVEQKRTGLETNQSSASIQRAGWRITRRLSKITPSNASTLCEPKCPVSRRRRRPRPRRPYGRRNLQRRRGARPAIPQTGKRRHPPRVGRRLVRGDRLYHGKARPRAVVGDPGGPRDDRGRPADDDRARKEEGLHVLVAPVADGRAEAEDLQAAEEALST